MKIKEYIRKTHNFDNKMREWELRGDKYTAWNNYNNQTNKYEWTLGVHALKNDAWIYLKNIIDETIDYHLKDGQYSAKVKEFKEDDFRKIVCREVLSELEELIKLDMVGVRDTEIGDNQKFYDFYNN